MTSSPFENFNPEKVPPPIKRRAIPIKVSVIICRKLGIRSHLTTSQSTRERQPHDEGNIRRLRF